MRPQTLAVAGLSVRSEAGPLVEDVNFAVDVGRVLAIVGPSGSGKTLVLRSIMGVLGAGLTRTGGVVSLDGRLAGSLHGTVGLLDQDARGSLDPLCAAGALVARSIKLSGQNPTKSRILEFLGRAGFAEPGAVVHRFPHELSGGMAQRVATAVALARGSRFLLCDEPTTGLDATVQRQVVAELRNQRALGLVFVTHDISLLPGFCDEVLVLDAGRVVDRAAAPEALSGPGRAFVAAAARLSARWTA